MLVMLQMMVCLLMMMVGMWLMLYCVVRLMFVVVLLVCFCRLVFMVCMCCCVSWVVLLGLLGRFWDSLFCSCWRLFRWQMVVFWVLVRIIVELVKILIFWIGCCVWVGFVVRIVVVIRGRRVWNIICVFLLVVW